MHSIFAVVSSAHTIDVFIGPCGTASDAGDCSAGTKGSWSMNEREASSWESAAASCVRRCSVCDRCRYVSFSTQWKDCSWFFACDLVTLRHDVFGFRSAAVNGSGGERHVTAHITAAAPIKSPFKELVGEDGRHSKRHGKRHGRGGRLRLRILTLPHAVGLTPQRRVPVRAADELRLVAPSDLVDNSGGMPMVEVATLPPGSGAAAAAAAVSTVSAVPAMRPRAWSHPAVFWPDETEEGPCFRIPSVLQTATGSLLAFAEARHGSCLDAYAVHIVSRASRDGGRTWSDLAVVAGNASVRLGNPTAVTLASGRLLLLLATHSAKCAGQCVTGNAVTVSDDQGVTWSIPAPLRAHAPGAPGSGPRWRGGARTGPGHALQLTSGPHAGRVLVPASTGTHRSMVKGVSHLKWSRVKVVSVLACGSPSGHLQLQRPICSLLATYYLPGTEAPTCSLPTTRARRGAWQRRLGARWTRLRWRSCPTARCCL